MSLLPEIHISTSPTFPRCYGISDSQVIVSCEIEPPVETFNVTWTRRGISAELVPISQSLCLVFTISILLHFFFPSPFSLIGKMNKIVIFFRFLKRNESLQSHNSSRLHPKHAYTTSNLQVYQQVQPGGLCHNRYLYHKWYDYVLVLTSFLPLT